ncbi:MAG: hypothetical protein NVS4B13_02990 [Candidatus Elarobacter sp.]
MRDVYATLRELVPNLAAPGDAIIVGWSDRAEPIWRRGRRWVRVEAVTQMQLLVVAGEGDQTVAQRAHVLTADLQPVALDVADLLSAKV